MTCTNNFNAAARAANRGGITTISSQTAVIAGQNSKIRDVSTGANSGIVKERLLVIPRSMIFTYHYLDSFNSSKLLVPMAYKLMGMLIVGGVVATGVGSWLLFEYYRNYYMKRRLYSALHKAQNS